MTTQPESSQGIGQMSLDFGTCEPSAPTTSPMPTSFAADSPARTSVSRGGGRGSRVSVAAYGESSPALLANYDPATHSWRTFQTSFQESGAHGWAPFSETWPRSGMMQNGIAYRLPPLVPRTYATEFSSSHIGRPQLWKGPEENGGWWPTPRSVDNGAIKTTRTDPRNLKASPTLSEAARMWPTPTASGFGVADVPKLLERRARAAAKHGNNGFGLTLAQAVKVDMWPTPQAHDATKGYPHRVGRYGTEHGARNLNDFAAASENRNGYLNPTWVEWLMGFPLGWTDLEDSETP
jgi:hypothetical protein